MFQDKDMTQLIRVASRAFDLGRWSGVTRLKGGILNESYRLQTSSGTYVMKVNRVRRSKTELEHLSSFLSYLEERGMTVDGIVPTTQGHAVFQDRGLFITVHRYIPGTVYHSPLALTSTQRTKMMAFLATYHAAVDDYQITQELVVSDEDLPIVYTEDPNCLKERLCSLEMPTRDLEATVNRGIDRLRVFGASESYKRLKRIANHGDYRSCNVVFDGNDIRGLLDWDLLSYGPRLLDVVVASNDLATVIAGPLSSHPDEWLEHFVRFLRTYATKAEDLNIGITEHEIEAIPYLLIVDTILNGILFALFLRKLPLKPGETTTERNQRSAAVLEQSVNDLLTLDELAMQGNTFRIKWTQMRSAISPC